MGILDRLWRRGTASTARPAPSAPRRPPRPGSKADTLPADATALAVYSLPRPDATPDARTLSLVVLDFDPVDVVTALAAGPALIVESPAALHARIERARGGPLRDPNSRGRLEFVRRWVIEQAPAWVGWRLEPAEGAGTGQRSAGPVG